MPDKNLYKKINFKENFKVFLKFARPYKWLFVVVIVLATLVELERLGEKYLFKIVLDNGSSFLEGTLGKSQFSSILLIVGGVFIGLILLKAGGHWFRIGILNKIEVRMLYDLKKTFFDHIITLHHGFHTTHKTGSMISRINRGTGALERMTDFLVFNIIPLILQIIIVGVSIFFFDKLTALIILILAVSFLVYGFFMSRIQKKAHILSNNAEDHEKGYVADIFTNIDSIKYFGKENLIKGRFEKISENTKITRLRFWDYGKYFSSGQSIIVGIGILLSIYFPLVKFLNGELSIGTLAFIYTVYGGLMDPLFGFVHGLRGFYIALGDFDELFQYGKIKNEIKDEKYSKDLKIKKGEIEFRDLNFKYQGRNEKTLHNLSLKIKQNEKVALVGHSGCGKTTLVKLLYRFYDSDSGQIIIDGENIKKFKQESLRSELSIVPQECILFDDTIYNNILFSNPIASKDQVFKAIQFAQLDNFISRLPKKENTIVGERGVKLSGGEKQRVSIARAILADKKVLVLDEATSSLDSQTEHEIQKDLLRLMKNRTSIIIAHRLSTIMSVDRIIVMANGKIVQIGNHRELINRKGTYRELWSLQKGGYIEE